MSGRLTTALWALMLALAVSGPIATTARIAPGKAVFGMRSDMDPSGRDDGPIVALVDDGVVQDDLQSGRALLGARMRRPCVPFPAIDRLPITAVPITYMYTSHVHKPSLRMPALFRREHYQHGISAAKTDAKTWISKH